MAVVGSTSLASSSLLAMVPPRIRPGDMGVGMPSSGVLRSYREDLGFSPARHAFPLPLYEPLHVPSTFLEELPLPLGTWVFTGLSVKRLRPPPGVAYNLARPIELCLLVLFFY